MACCKDCFRQLREHWKGTKWLKVGRLSLLELAILKAAKIEARFRALHDLGITCGFQVVIPLDKKMFLGHTW